MDGGVKPGLAFFYVLAAATITTKHNIERERETETERVGSL